MKTKAASIPGVKLIEPRVFGDQRGFFVETYSRERYKKAGIAPDFVQDNLSKSQRGTLRGMHLQFPNPQGKLCSVVEGEVFDVVVDLRLGSPTFRQWQGVTLSGENQHQLYVPPGLAHGFCVLSENAYFSYKCTDFYYADQEFGIAWDDPDIGIEWPIESPILSERDRHNPRLRDIAEDHLVRYE